MAYDQEMFEKVEYLRSKADITYEEAVDLLERYDADLTRVLIELERGGRIRPERAANAGHDTYEEERYHGHDARHGHGHGSRHASRFLTLLFKNRLQILKGEEVVINLPIAFYIALALFAPHLFIPAIAVMFLCGCRIRRKQESGTIREEDVSKFAANTARNIRTTVNSFTQTLHQEHGKPDEGSEDEGEVTVD